MGSQRVGHDWATNTYCTCYLLSLQNSIKSLWKPLFPSHPGRGTLLDSHDTGYADRKNKSQVLPTSRSSLDLFLRDADWGGGVGGVGFSWDSAFLPCSHVRQAPLGCRPHTRTSRSFHSAFQGVPPSAQIHLAGSWSWLSAASVTHVYKSLKLFFVAECFPREVGSSAANTTLIPSGWYHSACIPPVHQEF